MPQQPFYFNDGKYEDLSHYVNMATQIEQPDVNQRPLGEVEGAMRPLSLTNCDAKEIWKLKLEDAVRNALENSKVIRSIGGVSSPQSFVSASGSRYRRRSSRSKRTGCPRSTIRRLPRAARPGGATGAPAWRQPFPCSTPSGTAA